MSRPSPGVSGIILAGGRSRRMGQDKAFLEAGGRYLIEWVLDAVRAVADEIVLVTNAPAKYAGMADRITGDLFPGVGALAGIHAGLMTMNTEYGLVVACDMPFLNRELLRYMIDLAPAFDVVMPYVGADDPTMHQEAPAKARDLHPLHAIYRKTCVPAVEQAIRQGDYRVVSFLPAVRVRYVGRPEIERLDPTHLSFFNVNTPADFRKAQLLMAQGDLYPHTQGAE